MAWRLTPCSRASDRQVHATPSTRDSHADNAPEPVSATASTSQPHSAAGTVNACTAVGRSRPARAAPLRSQLALGAAPNMAAKDGAGLTEPPLGAVADPATAGASPFVEFQASKPPGTKQDSTSS